MNNEQHDDTGFVAESVVKPILTLVWSLNDLCHSQDSSIGGTAARDLHVFSFLLFYLLLSSTPLFIFFSFLFGSLYSPPQSGPLSSYFTGSGEGCKLLTAFPHILSLRALVRVLLCYGALEIVSVIIIIIIFEFMCLHGTWWTILVVFVKPNVYLNPKP